MERVPSRVRVDSRFKQRRLRFTTEQCQKGFIVVLLAYIFLSSVLKNTLPFTDRAALKQSRMQVGVTVLERKIFSSFEK